MLFCLLNASLAIHIERFLQLIFFQNLGWISSLFQVMKFLDQLVKWKGDSSKGPLSKV
jgi:hypothetical protein